MPEEQENNNDELVRHDTLLSDVEIKKDYILDSPLRRRLNQVKGFSSGAAAVGTEEETPQFKGMKEN